MKGDYVWMDGEVVEEATVSAVCPGVLVGMGIFETMAVYGGRVFAFGRHYARLSEGCGLIGFQVPAIEVLEDAMREVVGVNGISRGRMRVTLVDGGDGVRVIVSGGEVEPRVGAARLVVSAFRRNEFGALAGVKATAYAENLLILREADLAGADEAVILNTAGDVCEGATSNLFFVDGGKVFTPELGTGCLAGVTREIVLEVCGELGVEVEEGRFDEERLLGSDGVFLTGSGREVQRVGSVGDVFWDGEGAVVELIGLISDGYLRRVGDGAE